MPAQSKLPFNCFKTICTFFLVFAFLAGGAGRVVAFAPANPSAAPVVNGIAPATLPEDANTPVTIIGENFTATPLVKLGTTSLRDVVWVDASTLTALVPWGMAPGGYTLTVINPNDQSGSLPGAATVIAGVAGWVSNGPYGGKIKSLTLDPQDPQKIYAAVTRSGVFASADGAANWQLSTLAAWPQHLVVSHSPIDAATLLYIGAENGMLRSVDGGASWAVNIPDEVDLWMNTDPYLFFPAVHPGQSEVVYLGVSGDSGVDVHGGLFKSTDRGVTWTKLYTDTHVLSVAFDPQNVQKIYFATRDGKVYTSSDGGVNWSAGVTVAGRVEQVVVDPFPNTGGKHDVWAIDSVTTDPPQALFRSQDEGAAFDPVPLPSANRTVVDLTFHTAITGTLYVALGNGKGYVSDNYGSSWTQITGIPAASKIVDFVAVPDAIEPHNPAKTTLYAGTISGVFKSLDGGATWAEANTGMLGIVPTSIAYNPANPDEAYAAAVGWNVFKTRDGGRTWQATGVPSYGNSGSKVAVDPFHPQTVYATAACSWMPCLRTSPDGGATYTEEMLPTPPGLPLDESGISLAVAGDPRNDGRLLVGAGYFDGSGNPSSGAIFRRADAGAAWALVSTPPGQVQFITYDPQNALNIYAATGNGPYASQDGGLTWSKIASWPGAAWPGPIAVSPYDSQTIFAYGGGIYRSKDGGASWTKLTSFTGSVKDIRFMPQGAPYLYVATQVGLKRSLDEGETLENVGGLPGQANVNTLAFGVDGSRVVMYVGTTGGYITNLAHTASLDSQLKGGGVYRNLALFNFIYLPVVKR